MPRRRGRLVALFLIVIPLVSACTPEPPVAPLEATAGRPTPAADQTPAASVPSPSLASEQILASGEFELVAANAFGEPGFHEPFHFTHSLPADLGSTAGLRLVVLLQEVTRPEQTCSSQHPLSGCATVDWSDAEGRPKVPPGGVFDNSLAVELRSGERTFFLSELGVLADAPDAFDPG